jgi:CheY-like chemotaxis protein
MKKKILVIDDDPQFVSNMKQLLEANSYEVDTASSGKEGCVKAETSLPDLITIDVMMETWDEGFKVVDKLRENAKTNNIPRILLSAVGLHSSLDDLSSPELNDVEFVLQKPVKPAVLLDYVKKALAQ